MVQCPICGEARVLLSQLIQTEAQAKEWVLVMARFHLVCVQCRPSWQERAVDLLQKRLFQAVASPSDLSSVSSLAVSNRWLWIAMIASHK